MCRSNQGKVISLQRGTCVEWKQIGLQTRKTETSQFSTPLFLTSAFLLIHLAHDSAVVGSCEHGNEPSGGINCWDFLTPVLLHSSFIDETSAQSPRSPFKRCPFQFSVISVTSNCGIHDNQQCLVRNFCISSCRHIDGVMAWRHLEQLCYDEFSHAPQWKQHPTLWQRMQVRNAYIYQKLVLGLDRPESNQHFH